MPAHEVFWGQAGAGGGNNLVTSDDSKFQLDANLGLLAAVCESLVQSSDRKCMCAAPASGNATQRLDSDKGHGGPSLGRRILQVESMEAEAEKLRDQMREMRGEEDGGEGNVGGRRRGGGKHSLVHERRTGWADDVARVTEVCRCKSYGCKSYYWCKSYYVVASPGLCMCT